MDAIRHPILLAALAVALAGCTFLGGGPDESEGTTFDGPGLTLAVENEADVPFTVAFTVLDPYGETLNASTLVVPAGESEAWSLPIEAHGAHEIRMSYNWTVDGQAASGTDTQTLDTADCDDDLTRGNWRVFAGQQGSGSQFVGEECVARDA